MLFDVSVAATYVPYSVDSQWTTRQPVENSLGS